MLNFLSTPPVVAIFVFLFCSSMLIEINRYFPDNL